MALLNNLNDMTLDDFLELPYFIPADGQLFREVIVVPLPEVHESGYSLMKFILVDAGKLVGVVGGCTDLMWLLQGNKYSWNIDCLNKSKCVRIFTIGRIRAIHYGGSDFIFNSVE